MQRLLTGLCFGVGLAVIVAASSTIALGNVAFDNVAKSIVLIDTGDNIGTGFFIASNAHRSIILTAQHVIGAKKSVKVYARAGYGGSFVATVMRVDRDRDLALLSVPTGPFPTLPIAASATIGESVAAGGFDDLAYRYFKSSGDLQPNFHPGSVSSIRGPLVVHDVPTDEGNSGGPLFDVESGDVVGVVKGSFNQNYYAAVGAISVRKFLREAGVQPSASVAINATPTPKAIPTVASTPTPIATPGAAEIASILSGTVPWRNVQYGTALVGTINAALSGCTFSISESVVSAGYEGDRIWTGNLGDIDPASVHSWSTTTDAIPVVFFFGFSSKGGALAFRYQAANWTLPGNDQTQLWIHARTDPAPLVAPFRALILNCSSSPPAIK